MGASSLDAFLSSHERAGHDADVLSAIGALAAAALVVGKGIRAGFLDGAVPGYRATANSDAEARNDLDVHAQRTFLHSLRRTPVRCIASEERSEPTMLDPEARIALAIHPLAGSSNIDVNVPTGTIFSLLPAGSVPGTDPAEFFLRPGSSQLAAGFFVYGPRLVLVLSLGRGTHAFVFSPGLGTFVQTHESLAIPERTQEFAIEASNYRHWDEAVRLYVDDCLKGEEGPRGKNFDMRWIASLVAETHRILLRGGAFLHRATAGPPCERTAAPGPRSKPHRDVVEQAGGAATDATAAFWICSRTACTSACRWSSARSGRSSA